MSSRAIILYLTAVLSAMTLLAEDNIAQLADTGLPIENDIAIESAQSDTLDAVQKRPNLIGRIIRYFDEANKPKPEKKIDFSFIGGPSYSNDTKLSVGVLGAALYKSVPFDTLTSQSNASLYGEVAITGFYLVGIKGNHFGPRDNYRVNYKVYFESFPNYFWGIGYDNGSNNDNKTKFLQLTASVEAAFEWQPIKNLYIGPAIRFNYAKASNDDNDYALWDGEQLRLTTYGAGFNISYDSRDFITNAYSGVYVGFEQRFYPRFLKNDYCFSSSKLTLNYYHRVWKGGVVAGQFLTQLNYGNVPWPMLASLGGSSSMRGYYEGRYRDKCSSSLTVELRQHIYRRSSVVAWVGAGTIYPRLSDLTVKHILPNFGIGYRWEFKKRVNVRLDLGFGKGEKGFVFNINEAF